MSEEPTRVARIGVCAAFERGLNVVDFMTAQVTPVEFVATCLDDESEHEPQIAELCERRHVACVRKVDVNDLSFLEKLKGFGCDVIILAWWPNIVKQPAIDRARFGWINLHPSFLPYGRGKHGYFWTIVEGTPFGVTLHLVDAGVDSGPILFQKELNVEMTDTGESLYHRSADEVVKLFKKRYAEIACLDLQPEPQDDRMATSHRGKEIEARTEIDLGRSYTARDLIDLIRARTFLNGDSAYFHEDGQRYRVKMIIEKADEDG